MQEHSNTDQSSRDSLILACSEPVRAIAWSFARSASVYVEVEEMYSIGMLAVCEAAAADGARTCAYLIRCGKNAMVNEWRLMGRWSTAVSLDAPNAPRSESGTTLRDVLPAPALPSSAATKAAQKRERALYGAVRRLPKRSRAAVRLRHGLPGYGAHNQKEAARALGTTAKAVGGADMWGRRVLSRDARLCKVVLHG
jgi:DNA-directed RNA polymerase specialized sigma24 family protein